ncbi:MAG: protein kinase [Chlamydiales bacterium]|nr:protein kinase [Chlamydiales bacterium]
MSMPESGNLLGMFQDLQNKVLSLEERFSQEKADVDDVRCVADACMSALDVLNLSKVMLSQLIKLHDYRLFLESCCETSGVVESAIQKKIQAMCAKILNIETKASSGSLIDPISQLRQMVDKDDLKDQIIDQVEKVKPEERLAFVINYTELLEGRFNEEEQRAIISTVAQIKEEQRADALAKSKGLIQETTYGSYRAKIILAVAGIDKRSRAAFVVDYIQLLKGITNEDVRIKIIWDIAQSEKGSRAAFVVDYIQLLKGIINEKQQTTIIDTVAGMNCAEDVLAKTKELIEWIPDGEDRVNILLTVNRIEKEKRAAFVVNYTQLLSGITDREARKKFIKIMVGIPVKDRAAFVINCIQLLRDISDEKQRTSIIFSVTGMTAIDRVSFIASYIQLLEGVSDDEVRTAIIQAVSKMVDHGLIKVVIEGKKLVEGISDDKARLAIILAVTRIDERSYLNVIIESQQLIKGMTNGYDRVNIILAVADITMQDRVDFVAKYAQLLEGIPDGKDLTVLVRVIAEIDTKDRMAFVNDCLRMVDGVGTPADKIALLATITAETISKKMAHKMVTACRSLVDGMGEAEQFIIADKLFVILNSIPDLNTRIAIINAIIAEPPGGKRAAIMDCCIKCLSGITDHRAQTIQSIVVILRDTLPEQLSQVIDVCAEIKPADRSDILIFCAPLMKWLSDANDKIEVIKRATSLVEEKFPLTAESLIVNNPPSKIIVLATVCTTPDIISDVPSEFKKEEFIRECMQTNPVTILHLAQLLEASATPSASSETVGWTKEDVQKRNSYQINNEGYVVGQRGLGALIPSAITTEETDNFNKLIDFQSELLEDFTEDDKKEIKSKLIPKLLQASHFLIEEYKKSGVEKPEELKISGTNSQFLSIKLHDIKYIASVKILKDGTIVYSLPRAKLREGGFKKVTFKLFSSVSAPESLEARAKFILKPSVRKDRFCQGNIKTVIELSPKLAHPNVAVPIQAMERISATSLDSVGYMPIMQEIQLVIKDLTDQLEHKTIEEQIEILCSILDLLGQIAQGLEHIDKAGYVHNDIKPGNILVAKELVEGKLKLVAKVNDFDLMTTKSAAESGERMDVGTEGYFIFGIKRSIHSDMYALCVTLRKFLPALDKIKSKITITDEKGVRVRGVWEGIQNKITAEIIDKIAPLGAIAYPDSNISYRGISAYLTYLQTMLRNSTTTA